MSGYRHPEFGKFPVSGNPVYQDLSRSAALAIPAKLNHQINNYGDIE
jgi:hypothetical protein